jgi:hypothetical protein
MPSATSIFSNTPDTLTRGDDFAANAQAARSGRARRLASHQRLDQRLRYQHTIERILVKGREPMHTRRVQMLRCETARRAIVRARKRNIDPRANRGSRQRHQGVIGTMQRGRTHRGVSACDGGHTRRVAYGECSSDYGVCNGVTWFGGRKRILTTSHLVSVATPRGAPSAGSKSMYSSWRTLRMARSR